MCNSRGPHLPFLCSTILHVHIVAYLGADTPGQGKGGVGTVVDTVGVQVTDVQLD